MGKKNLTLSRTLKTTVIEKQQQTDQLRPELNKNYNRLLQDFSDNADVVFKEFTIYHQVKVLLCYVEGISDEQNVHDGIVRPLVRLTCPERFDSDFTVTNFCQTDSVLKLLKNKILTIGNISTSSSYKKIVECLLIGMSVVIIDGSREALVVGTERQIGRPITEPMTEVSVLGPQEAFTESLYINYSLIRQRLRTKNLKINTLIIGVEAKSMVGIAYVEGIVNPKIVKELKKRLQRIQIDGVLDSAVIEEFIRDSPFSIFPTVRRTERVDSCTASLLEGRVAIVVDRSPLVLLAPSVFFDYIMAAEDYYDPPIAATLLRFLRLIALHIALILPALYISFVTYHHEMVPNPLLISVAIQREEVPYPALIEAFIMEAVFEILREAGLRLPRVAGQAVSIVGALVIGEAAVRAGLVSPAMVIVVALTAIASFVIPRYTLGFAIRILRFPLMLLASVFGLYGVILGYMAILIHLAGLRSFGMPYLYPIAPSDASGLKDSLIRVPWWAMLHRPAIFLNADKRQRVAPNQRPKPPIKRRK
ncbi:spore germination protein [Heliorestis acidaminivorans]|uniref:Spore germination protein n=1 Tax=Heliorestis acidaminivorans TaxID=553427 RepID=A0A6I0F469_9FIRM|nr:spore germination protein [Heliorestis acidaminivorans]KAB2951970.1 spore germination protein [Heliorestis acidaminivorans]